MALGIGAIFGQSPGYFAFFAPKTRQGPGTKAAYNFRPRSPFSMRRDFIMASNYTENYGLCQWEATDSFVRTEFNQDNARIDAALKDLEDTKAEQAALSSLSATVSGKASQSSVNSLSGEIALKCRVKAGTYTGNGAASQRIDVGFSVKAVLVERENGLRNQSSNYGARGGLAVSGHPLHQEVDLVKVSGSGFYVYNGGEFQGSFNADGNTYYYVAFG